MERKEIEERSRAILVEHLGVEAERIVDDVRFVPETDIFSRIKPDGAAHLECDSLDVVELVMAHENEFRVEIDDDDAEKLQEGTFKDLVGLLVRKIAERDGVLIVRSATPPAAA